MQMDQKTDRQATSSMQAIHWLTWRLSPAPLPLSGSPIRPLSGLTSSRSFKFTARSD